MAQKINNSELENKPFSLVRNPKTKATQSVMTLYDLKVGAIEKKANIIASGDLKICGSSRFIDGVEGALTLPDGTPTVRAGNNVTITKNPGGSIIINAAADTSSLEEEFAAVPGLVDSLSTQVSSLALTVSSLSSNLGLINSSITSLQSSVNTNTTTIGNHTTSITNLDADVTTLTSNIAGFALDSRVTSVSSSFTTTISNVSSSLNNRITAVSGSLNTLSDSVFTLSGSLSALEVTVANLRCGLGSNLLMNDQLVGLKNGLNKTFNLSHVPSPASSLMVFVNGQLLTGGNGADFIVIGDEITLSQFIPAPREDDTLFAMYTYETTVTSYSINEPAIATFTGGQYKIDLTNAPAPSGSLMLFMNGQLLTKGATNDYTLSGSLVSLESSLRDISESRFFATYSY